MTLSTLVLTGATIIGILVFCVAILIAIIDEAREPVRVFFGAMALAIIVTALYAGIQSLIYLVAKGIIS